MGEAAKKARDLLNAEGVILAPVSYDALSAKLIEHTGFQMAGTSGHAISAAMLGVTDFGLVMYNEMLDALTRMCEAVDIPIIADAEGGYGNAINTIRTVKGFEKAGLGGLLIEDQKLPTSCPANKKPVLIRAESMVGKIHAALDARKDENFIVVARTDAPFEEACDRANMYLEAGADMVKARLHTREELIEFPKRVKGPIHLAFNASGKNDGMTVWDAYKLGYKVITFPLAGILARVKAELEAYQMIFETGTWDSLEEKNLLVDREKFVSILGKNEILRMIEQYFADE